MCVSSTFKHRQEWHQRAVQMVQFYVELRNRLSLQQKIAIESALTERFQKLHRKKSTRERARDKRNDTILRNGESRAERALGTWTEG